MAIFSVSGAEVRLHTEQPVHFSLGTLPQNPRYSHNPTAVRFLGLSLDRPPRPLPRSHCRPQSLCSVVSSRAPVNQISQIAPQVSPHHHPTPCPPLPTALSLPPPGQELWRHDTCEGLPPQRPQIALPDPPQTRWLPLTRTHLNSRQDRSVNLPGESQVVRKNRD